MTYWYLGVQELVEAIRAQHPETKIILGGVYATICPVHARGLGAVLVVAGTELARLWRVLELAPDDRAGPLWDR